MGKRIIHQAGLRRRALELWNAYVYLRDNDFGGLSSTSTLLNKKDLDQMYAHLHEELHELAGVMEGTHIHQGMEYDIVLEASQVCYWVYLIALASGTTYEQLAPDFFLSRGAAVQNSCLEIQAKQLRETAFGLASCDRDSVLPPLHTVLELVGAACTACQINVREIVEFDLRQMQGRSYVAPYLRAKGVFGMQSAGPE